MATLKESLEKSTTIDGAVGAAVVDHKSGMSLGVVGGQGLNMELAAAGNTEVVRAKLKVMNALGIPGGIEDMLISLGNQYHLIRTVKNKPHLFVYLILNRAKANLAMARHVLSEIEAELQI